MRSIRTAPLMFLLIGHALHAQVEADVLVSARGNDAVFRYDLEGTWLGEFIPSGYGGLLSTQDMLTHPDGSLLVTGAGNTAVKRYDSTTGAYLGNFTSGYALEIPTKMSIGPDSLLYVMQWGSAQQKVARFDLDGQFIDEFPSVDAPLGLGHFWDSQGRMYIALYGNGATGTVHRYGADGTDLGVFINSAVLQGPTHIWQEEGGDVLVQDWTTGNVLRYDSTGSFVGYFITGLTNPEGVGFLPNGDLLMGDWGEDAVHRIDAEGNDLGYFASGNELSDPNAVLVRDGSSIGIGEATPRRLGLTVTPSAGAGPFQLGGLPSGQVRLRMTDAMGRVVDDRIVTYTGGGLTWEPGVELCEGMYRISVEMRAGSANTALFLAR